MSRRALIIHCAWGIRAWNRLRFDALPKVVGTDSKVAPISSDQRRPFFSTTSLAG